ncbi:MAG: GntR family transcriptional regulator [Alphaproteobacteria bacterium]|nr:GntR family transcriptional regulator [Alphaproteobacteria bacterium]MDX5368988.1 GntR family transcriptional regulator [Alphaproteobacteria bacterium]MDX5463688.1 GntR family transcriptional regulator [Alphaproteobacteria bacterium]
MVLRAADMRTPACHNAQRTRQSVSPEDGNKGFGTGRTASQETEEPGFQPVQARSLTEEVARQLHEAIVVGRLKLGQRISESVLSREMGISRGPIREAERQLAQQGLLVFSPRRGFFVRDLTADQINDVFRVRIVLERFAVEEAARTASDADLARLADWRAMMCRRQQSLSPAEFVEHDLALHRLIVDLAGSDTLRPLFENVINQVRLGLSLINLRFGRADRIAQGHDDIVSALLARDGARAAAAMEAHLVRSRDLLLERLKADAQDQDRLPPARKDQET